MKKILFHFILAGLCLNFVCSFAQTESIKVTAMDEKEKLGVFMSLWGYEAHQFKIKTKGAKYLVYYIDEYRKDSLVSHEDLLDSKQDMDTSLYKYIFPRIEGNTNEIKVYLLNKSDSVTELQIRFMRNGTNKTLKKISGNNNYEVKIALSSDKNNKIELNKRYPVLYYSTAMEEMVGEDTINRFCNIADIIDHRTGIGSTGLAHYFVIGIRLLDKLD